MLSIIKSIFTDFGDNWQQYLKSTRNYLFAWGINFAIVYFVATEEIGLCFIIAMIMTQAYSSVGLSLREMLKTLIPIHQSLDNSINSLFSSKDEHSEKIEMLENKILELESKIEEMQSQ